MEGHVFGVDSDPDACRVTELGLILTLLDYVDPPDLLPKAPARNRSAFKLPKLRETNVFHANFFEPDKAAKHALGNADFDWVVGNPPWKDLDSTELIEQDQPVWEWMSDPANKNSRPCGDNEVAQAFAWHVADFLKDRAAAALLLPAMTLFEDVSRKFRARFFRSQHVTAVANFSNLAEVLFAGRARVPAAAFFYQRRAPETANFGDEAITVFSPLVANQEVTRPDSSGKRVTTWSLFITASEMRELTLAEVALGDGLPWKLAAWGSQADTKLLKRISSRFMSLGQLKAEGIIDIAEGPALVSKHVETGKNRTTLLEEVVDKLVLNVKVLSRLRSIFTFPKDSLVKNMKHFGHDRRGFRGLSVCRPPHVIVSAARIFAVFTDDYLIVPPRQIGITSNAGDVAFLKALSLYLSSDFAFYQQFLTATQFGVQRGRGTLKSLRSLPVPLARYSPEQLKPWVILHGRLSHLTPVKMRQSTKGDRGLFDNHRDSAAGRGEIVAFG